MQQVTLEGNILGWVCPKGCLIEYVLVCGGDLGNENGPNVYFRMQLDGSYTNLFSDGTKGVSEDCYAHADGGCSLEPQCPECHEYCVKTEIVGEYECKDK